MSSFSEKILNTNTTNPKPNNSNNTPPTTKKMMTTKHKRNSWSEFWLENTNPLQNIIFTMKLPPPSIKKPPQTLVHNFPKIDRTLLLSDVLMLKILSLLPESQKNANFLVCKRWLNLQGRLVRSIKVLDWEFIESGRIIVRFPNLTQVDLVNGCLVKENSDILVSHKSVKLQIGSGFSPYWRMCEENILPVEVIDRGLKALASGCPNLRKLVVIGASEFGLLSVAEECLTLQDLELHKCNDQILRGIAACTNLQILRLVGSVNGFYRSLVSDIGLTILAQGCKRLVKLELAGCEGSFDGIKAIGQCCQMLEELTFCGHKMESGWLAGLSYYENLNTLRFLSCERIDSNPGPEEYLGFCPSLETLHLQKCQLRDKKSLRALFKVCESVKGIVIRDCWGLNNEMFNLAKACRRVKSISLEGCSLLSTEGVESVILSWNQLESLSVISCKNLKNEEISPALLTLFAALKGLKWTPDAKSLLAPSLVGTGMGKKGRKLFKKSGDIRHPMGWTPLVLNSEACPGWDLKLSST
ncbi:hypothetical protein ACFE04_027275 [Oxalis oulophora]